LNKVIIFHGETMDRMNNNPQPEGRPPEPKPAKKPDQPPEGAVVLPQDEAARSRARLRQMLMQALNFLRRNGHEE